MSKKDIKDLGASIQQRLLNLAKESNRPFDEVLQYYMIERFIDRLSQSEYKNRMILKGALMFMVWDLAESRATRDIDFLGRTDNSIENVTKIVSNVCEIGERGDGVVFFPESVECEIIQERNEYSGIRARFNGEIASARTRLQIDIGFGDVVYPGPINLGYPTLLNMSSPQILAYTPESLIAEKMHAIIRHGINGTRIKDYFDVWFLSHQFAFQGEMLAEAIDQTFTKRGMSIKELNNQIFSGDYENNESKQKQWEAFIEKNRFPISPAKFKDAIAQIRLFISPIFEAKSQERHFQLIWHAPGPWV